MLIIIPREIRSSILIHIDHTIMVYTLCEVRYITLLADELAFPDLQFRTCASARFEQRYNTIYILYRPATYFWPTEYIGTMIFAYD